MSGAGRNEKMESAAGPRQVVLLTGASGSMGSEAFRLLWEKRTHYKIVLLLRPSRANKKQFATYERQSGIVPIRGAGTVESDGLKIVWGDVLERADVEEACRGIDWCLHTLALISPEADRRPEMANLVNARGTRYIVEAIEARDPEHTRMVYIGSVAEYGDRLPPVHVGRTGDPIVPSVFDTYALSKIEGELCVMQSGIKHRVSLRQTFIMIPGLFSLMDPIMFHQPLHSMMENVTARDAGRLLVRCLDLPADSDFWGGYYNISGGPGCRTTYLEFLRRIYLMLGIDYRKAMDRQWFALKNFHMQYFEDASVLNDYLGHWRGGQTMEDFYEEVRQQLPLTLKVTAWLNKKLPPFRWMVQRATHSQLKKLARREHGPLWWIREGDTGKINAFFGSVEAFRAIPGWEGPMPSLDVDQSYRRLDHGYPESKKELTEDDLQQAARFRGGSLVSAGWNGEMNLSLDWVCSLGHPFSMTPHAVLKGGHWCPRCIAPPWEYGAMVKKNRFAAQLWGG